ncbi:MAG: protein kinase [Planctomycetota bacterium]
MNSTPTPSQSELADFVAGRLSESACARIERYLAENDTASNLLRDVEIDDPLCDRLRSLSTDGSSIGVGSVSDRQAEVGGSVGKYQLRRLIGRGGMGDVYEALDPVLDRTVAVKLLREAPEDTESYQRLIAEARSQAALNDPNIITVYEAGTNGASGFIAMELADSGSLADRVEREGRLPWREAFQFAAEACSGLTAAHAAGLIHRDIKPANLLTTGSGVVKLADFGLAKPSARTHTAGQLAGTPHFMSPEQCKSEPIDARSDVYALGATLFALLTGEKPFSDSESPMQVMFAHCERPAPEPRDWDAAIPAKVSAVVKRAMAKRPDERFESAAEFSAALSAALNDASVDVETAGSWSILTRKSSGPAIGVLPFRNNCQGDDQDYFVEGVTDEIVTQLTRFRELRVIARHSVSEVCDQSLSVQEIGGRLGARYLVEGDIRRAGSRIRVTARLVDANAGDHLWAERYDRDLTTADLFNVQDDIACRVATAVAEPFGIVFQHEKKEIARSSATTIEAYEFVLHFYDYWRNNAAEQLPGLLRRGEELVAEGCLSGDTWACLSLLHVDSYRFAFDPDLMSDESLPRALACAEKAVALDPQSSNAQRALATALFHKGDLAAYRDAAKRSIQLNPNHSDVVMDAAVCFASLGETDRAAELYDKAIDTCPFPPAWYFSVPVISHFIAGRFDDCLAAIHKFEPINLPFFSSLFRAACLGHTGRPAEAKSDVERLHQLPGGFAWHFEVQLKLWNYCPQLVETLSRGVDAIGLLR